MNDSQLDHLLNSCGSIDAPPGFASDVWRRISAEPNSAGMLSAWKLFVAATFTRLSQPAVGFAAAAIFVLVGTVTGYGSRPEPLPSEVRYIQSVSPFIHNTGR